uniref:Myb-like domain-containing protein n=1 Tax=Periophthalmus magnuspinnatus TaxID=409849 RepID=A0A3B3ZGD1_9GOBI
TLDLCISNDKEDVQRRNRGETEEEQRRNRGETEEQRRNRGETEEEQRRNRGETEEEQRRNRGETKGTKAVFSNSELLELEEFIPNVQSKSLEVKQKLLRYDLPRFREFKRKGLKLRWGRYSEEENLQIRRNVEDFLKLTLIQTPEELFFPQRFPEREHSLRDVRANHRFYQRIAEGLLRTCDQVYVRSKKIFDPRNHMGRFSEDELQALQKLHTIHGNDWKTIANKLERSIYACEKRHAQIGKRSEHGPWTPEEMHRLKRATKKHLKRALESSPSPGLDLGVDPGPSFFLLCSKLPWKKISQKVKSRSPDQCRRKWSDALPSLCVPVCQILYQLQVEDVSDVDWIQVAQSVG